MRNLVLFLMLVSLISFNGNSQTTSDTEYDTTSESDFINAPWKLSVGVNSVGSLGTRQPLERLGDFQFKNPLALAIEHKWSKFFALEQDLTLNGYEAKSQIDNGVLTKDYTYISTNTYVKYYFSDALFAINWLDLYTGVGFGLFSVDELNSSGNVVCGGTIWISDKIGVRLQGVGKFAINAKDRQFDNNHFQYMLQAVFKL
ncbi:hypothetical protein [Psychroserpens ponticola]|uniref:Outer membrane protein beta-barrel domain-containing protein n=1 Tax=Psychroserpens ponticola TaxID=2932268 RepID=A0ABY7RZN3_9FLAO|nr:hypothetical protein [Psychroserpens ponticola]WCO01155.1 hypothetical protein MUN68_013915 [Psychroserpens ponticola]